MSLVEELEESQAMRKKFWEGWGLVNACHESFHSLSHLREVKQRHTR